MSTWIKVNLHQHLFCSHIQWYLNYSIIILFDFGLACSYKNKCWLRRGCICKTREEGINGDLTQWCTDGNYMFLIITPLDTQAVDENNDLKVRPSNDTVFKHQTNRKQRLYSKVVRLIGNSPFLETFCQEYRFMLKDWVVKRSLCGLPSL